jgi:hypothetical protein
MAVNRFYTPSLPQYTSQFVEDKTPWEPILGFEQQKLQRGEKALEYAAETDALTKSLMPGYRTQDIAPQITENYKQKMNKWMQDYGETSYSMPALRELTKINAEFRGDPEVKKVMQDREASQLYEQWRKSPNYRPESDPNIDHSTGKLKQLQFGEQYSPYTPTVDYANIGDEINQQLSVLKPNISTSAPRTAYVAGPIDPRTGKATPIPVMAYDRISQLNNEDIKATEDAYVKSGLEATTPAQQYQKAVLGDKYNEEYLRDRFRQEVPKYTRKDVITDYNNLPTSYGNTGRGKKTGTKEPEHTYTGPVPYTSSTGVSSASGISFDEPAGTSSLGQKVENWSNRDLVTKMYEVTGGENAEGKSGDLYKKYRDDIPTLVNEESFAHIKGEGRGRVTIPDPLGRVDNFAQVILQRRLFEDPGGTVTKLDDYERQVRNAGPTKENGDILNNISKARKFINTQLEANGITEKGFESPLAFDQAKYSAINSRLVDLPGSPFKNTDDLKTTKMEDMTPSKNRWLRATVKSYEREQAKTVGFGQWESLPEADTKKLNEIYFGKTLKPDGTFTESKGVTAAFMGARIIDPEHPDKEMDKDEKAKVFTKDKAAFIDGRLTDETSQFGPGTIIVNAKGKTYYITGPDQMTEPHRFENAVYSKDFSNRHGQGDPFAVQGIDVNNFNISLNDRWTNKSRPSFGTDTWMAFRDNPNTNNTEIIFYGGNPQSDKKYNQPYSDKNPDGYRTQEIKYKIPGKTPEEDQWVTATSSDVKSGIVSPIDLRHSAMAYHIMMNAYKEAETIKKQYKDDPEKLKEKMASLNQQSNATLGILEGEYDTRKKEELYNKYYGTPDEQDNEQQ